MNTKLLLTMLFLEAGVLLSAQNNGSGLKFLPNGHVFEKSKYIEGDSIFEVKRYFFENRLEGKKLKEQIESKGYLYRHNHISAPIGNWVYWNKKGDIVLEIYIDKNSYNNYYINQWDENKNQILKNGNGKYYFLQHNIDSKDSIVHNVRDSVLIPTHQTWRSKNNDKYTLFESVVANDVDKNEVKIQYDEDGRIKSVFTMRGSAYDGEYVSFYANGVIYESGRYSNNKKEKTWRKYDNLGALIEEANYLEGELSGRYAEYHPNGTKKIVGHYIFDLVNVEIKTINPATYEEKVVTKQKVAGVKDGYWLIFDKVGTILSSTLYSKGKVISSK